MRFDSAARLSEVVWNARLADMPRGENRAVLNRCYNGEPPFDESKAEENNTEINRNFLQGTRLLTDARRQWYSALLKPGNFFTVGLDDGPVHKRQEWSHIITTEINRRLKRSMPMMEQIRATGAQVMLHGIGPTVWRDRRDPIPIPIPIASLLIPSETDLDFSNLEWYSVFREWTPTQVMDMTSGPKVDPGWNMKLVSSQLKYVAEEYRKKPNSTAYQYMPEKIEELVKQDGGFWGSDAVPTIDVWDCYFREAEDGKGWYRRIFLDWDLGKDEVASYRSSGGMPNSADQQSFLYTSGKRVYGNKLSEMLHCQFGDCSAVAPFKYHSVRSLGWMMWGVVDLMNRLQCKFNESVFEQMLWFFRTAGQQDFDRIKKAVFSHMGVIPQGVSFVPANERFKPDPNLVQMGLGMMRQILSENAASYVQDFDQGGDGGKEMTATETMARVNNVNTMVSGMLNLAYAYQTPQYREIARRFCIKNSPYADARAFQKACLRAGVPADYLDAERWDIDPERTLGGGNKTLEIAQANQLLQMRQYLGPDAQRRVDHIAVEVFTDDPALAEDLAPSNGNTPMSKSQHDAQLSTDRILRGLQFTPMPDMVYEDYVQVWLQDMAKTIQNIQQTGGIGTMQDVIGLSNLAQHIQAFVQAIGGGQEDQPRLKQYADMLGQLMNHVKGMSQRIQEAQGQQQGANGNGEAALTQGKVQSMQITAQAKAQNMKESHALKTAQRQAQWELDNQRKDKELQANMRRKDAETMQELGHEQARVTQELGHEGAKTAQQMRHDTLQTMQEMASTAATQAQEPPTESTE